MFKAFYFTMKEKPGYPKILSLSQILPGLSEIFISPYNVSPTYPSSTKVCNSSAEFKYNYRVGDAKTAKNLDIILVIYLWTFLTGRNILCYKSHMVFLTYTALSDVFKTDKLSILAVNFYMLFLSEQIEFEGLGTVTIALIYKSKIPPTKRTQINSSPAQEQAYCPI